MTTLAPSPTVRGDRLITDEEFRLIRELVYEKTGISLSNAKRSLVQCRLAKRLRALSLKDYRDYYRLLVSKEETSGEMQTMINCITTNKTDFFRERHHFEFLSELVAERIAVSDRRPWRIWCAASSRGHEPYTIAMTLLDALEGHSPVEIKILATDIDTDVLAHAQRAVYTLDEVDELSYEQKRRYLLRGTGASEGVCRIKPEVRSLVTFRRFNLVHDQLKPSRPFDAIFLRNVLIYFDRETQQKTLDSLRPALMPEGHLFLGHSENICWKDSGYIPLGATVYQRTESRT
ncbi:MAG TPA: protein-glutamate O-methyltransferase CheR [Pirellulaceae bacterium]|jgi:chemotaxis protein methyltransferase CheR|nr:protein-glutamate O-methyltransferase CheR [Pirellulaceae bacterium]